MKAVIETGGKQYLVAKDDVIDVELLDTDKKTTTFTPLAIIDGEKTKVGTPILEKSKVTAQIIEADKKADKISVIKFQAKKRVYSNKGHRQRRATIKITSIA